MIPCCRIGTLMASTAESWGGEHAETAIAKDLVTFFICRL